MLLALPAEAKLSRQEFMDARQEVTVLTLERLRSQPGDARALAAGENQLRRLHEEYQVQGSTPPTALAADAAALRGEGQKMIRLRAAGRPVPVDPRAAEALARVWGIYKAERELILERVASEKAAGQGESQTYWAATREFDRLAERTTLALVHNPPPGEPAGVLARDRHALLTALEFSPRRTRAPRRAVAAAVHTLETDVSPFYRAVDELPEEAPLAAGVLVLPPGTRTVTERRAGMRLVLRPSKGKGVAYVGSQEIELGYAYTVIPPDTAYYFENLGEGPLEIAFAGLGQ